jgi:tetratricopeptide (TPR) repeat protein
MWVWGTGTGGSNWQKFLSPPGEGYIEIQAGLTATQLEHLHMPPGADWSWLEAYGLLQADAALVHSTDWEQVIQSVEAELQFLSLYTELTREYEQGAEYSQAPPEAILQRGSGWGALERRRREACGEPLFTGGLIFDDDSLDKEQMPWISLLEKGLFPVMDPQTSPTSFVVGEKWRYLLNNALQSGIVNNWVAWLHMGIMDFWAGDLADARNAWERSMELVSTPWAARNLGVLSWEQGRLDEAAGLLINALHMAPHLLPLAIETGRCLLEAGRSQEWLVLMDELPESVRTNGRIRLQQAQAALAEDNLRAVARFFEERIIVDDLREGERSLADLWFAYQMKRVTDEEYVLVTGSLRARISADYPLPEEFDFSMTPT